MHLGHEARYEFSMLSLSHKLLFKLKDDTITHTKNVSVRVSENVASMVTFSEHTHILARVLVFLCG